MRFVIMHEIAYKLLLDYAIEFLPDNQKEDIKDIVFDSVSSTDVKLESDMISKQLCNDFAIEAIMPRKMFNRFNNGSIDKNLDRVSEYFGLESQVVKSYCKKINVI